VTVAVVTGGFPPDYTEEEEAGIRREAVRAHEMLKVCETVYWDFPAARLDTVAHRDLNKKMGDLYQRLNPAYVFVPFLGDVHLVHQRAFQPARALCRPNGGHRARGVPAYEKFSKKN